MSPGLLPDLAGHSVIGGELVRVLKLVGPECAGLIADSAGRPDHVAGQLLRHPPAVAMNDIEPGTEDPHVVELLASEGVGRDDMQRMALYSADEGKRYAGAAAGIFDHRAAGLQPTVRLG
jgi:hypothetical protein